MTLLLAALRCTATALRCALFGHGEPVGPTPALGRHVWTCARCGGQMGTAPR